MDFLFFFLAIIASKNNDMFLALLYTFSLTVIFLLIFKFKLLHLSIKKNQRVKTNFL